MEKETLQKIYNLKKIKPEESFVESTRRKIFGETEKSRKEAWVLPNLEGLGTLLNASFRNNALTVVGAFVFVFFFMSYALPLSPLTHERVSYLPVVANLEEKGEEIREVPEDKDYNTETARVRKPIETEFSSLENSFREIQRQVLGTMFNSDDPKEIAELAIQEAERKMEEPMQIMIMNDATVQEDAEEKDDDRLERAKQLVENAQTEEDYYEAFDLLVDILVE